MRPLRLILPAAAVLLALAGCSTTDPGAADSPAPVLPSQSPKTPQEPVKTGWDAAAGTIAIGDGPARIDVWFDPMCPYCAKFDEAQRENLAAWSTGGKAQVVLHPLSFLDRASEGSAYSTRADTVLVAAAEHDTAAVLPILLDLYEHQPAEHTAGLTDEQLTEIAAGHDVDVRPALRDRAHDARFARESTAAFSGQDAITGTPTMRIDGNDVPSDALYDSSLRSQVDTYLGQH
jgi:protein-disulfide isomerase